MESKIYQKIMENMTNKRGKNNARKQITIQKKTNISIGSLP